MITIDIINAAMMQQRPLIRLLSDRIVVVLTLAYLSGIVAVRFFIAGHPGAYWLAGVIPLLLLIALIFKEIDLFRAILILAVASAGGIAFFFAVQPPAGGLSIYKDYPVYVEGTVAEEPQYYEDHTAYRLQVSVVETQEGRFAESGTVLVKLYGAGAGEKNFWFGERLRLRGVITEARGQRNPGAFNYRFYLQSQGIDAVIYPKPSMVSSLGQGDLNHVTLSALKLRSSMTKAISSTLPSPSAELLAAVLFGQRHLLPAEVEQNFRRAGVGHLMAVSGLHVGLIAALILGLWRRINLQGPLPLLLAIILIFTYAFLTGMSPSALRAAIMVSLVLAALLLNREHDLPTAVALAAMITLFINPLLLFTVGFQLSYAATLTIIYAYRPLEKILFMIRCPRFLRSILAITLAAQIGVLPLSLYYFHHLPAGALLFNLLLLPLIGFVVGLGLTGALLSLIFPLLGELLLWASRPLLELMLYITGLSSMSWFYLAIYPPDVPVLVIFYCLLVAVLIIYYRWNEDGVVGERGSFTDFIAASIRGLFPEKFRTRSYFFSIMLFVVVVIIWSGIIFPAGKPLRLTFIDVGQGAAAIIETPCGKVLLVDGGGEPAYRGDPGEIGERVLLPLIRRRGIKNIDLAVISHPHEDHFGGFIPLFETVTVQNLLIPPVQGESIYYDQLLEDAESSGVAISLARPGQIWSCGNDLMLKVIGPPEKLLRGTNSDINNNSVVFILYHGEIGILFAGDIEDAAVDELLRHGVDLKADLLLVPHHGGYMKAMPVFLEAVQPSVAVIQVGRNSFGHPHPFVISSLEEAGVKIYRNDQHGAVIVETEGSNLIVTVTEQAVPVNR